ncbi:DUF2357 domain-containing protein [Thermodesulfobacteriota bacterium]
MPETSEESSIRTIGERLDDLMGEDAGWADWLTVLPLVPGISEKIEVNDLERAIDRHLGHLTEVCRKPRSHLRVEIERMTVSRARRIYARAGNYLAAHTEDWEHRKLREVLPKRILSEVRDDQRDIYENRFAARLIDHLQSYLNRRISDIRRLKKMLEEADDYSSSAVGSRHRRDRIFTLWGEMMDAGEGREKAEHTLRQLERLKYRLMGLMDSPLYKEIPRRAAVSNRLKMTNIFSNDPHYRHVAELWRRWSRHGILKSRSRRQVYQDHQSLCRYFDNFCLLLALRALNQLGFTPDKEGRVVSRGKRFRLSGPGGSATFVWTEDGVAELHRGTTPLLRIVPIIACIWGAPSSNILERHLENMAESVLPENGALTLVLYPSPPEENWKKIRKDLQLRLQTLGNDTRTSKGILFGMLPVSPWDIGSVERVARALRWVLTGPLFLSYPPKVASPTGSTVNLKKCSEWLRQERKTGECFLLRVPREDEASALKLDETLESLRRKRDDFIRAIDEEHPHSRNRGRLKKEFAERETELNKFTRFRDSLNEAVEYIARLLACPTCPTSADSLYSFEVRAEGHFFCSCPNCGTQWGTKTCGACGAEFPFILAAKVPEVKEASPGWVDQILGSDVLAVPSGGVMSERSLICPDCGHCPSEELENA